uniref:Retrotransposon gag domain-containing protein n=1 Tax=Tanacetum cinerariifolium TaxID=118510 RepID=A0A6L2LID1_TANCI|nr:hypothetical protein [Tanacetum cinerariifolium]
MVNTRNTEPRVLDETLRSSILEVVQQANGSVNATLTTLQTDLHTLTDRIQALMMFQTFAIGELTRLGNGDGTSNGGCGYGRLVSMHLYDKALEWHTQFLKIHGENVLWPDYEKEILARFSSVFEDPMVKLKNLKQDGEVKVYQEQFEVLLNRLDLTESYADVTLALTKTKHVSQYVGSRTNSHACANRYVSSVPPVNKLVLSLPSSSTETVGKVVKSGFRKQLTQKELEEGRAKGLCFYCDQRYALGHKGYVGKQTLHILIDCDSTYNFLDVSAAKKLPCHLTPTTLLRVDVANGSRIGKKIMLRGSQSGSLQWIQGKQDIKEGQWKQAQLASMIVCVYTVGL